jgi:hypothetical protein
MGHSSFVKILDNFISKRLYFGLLVLRKKNETSQSSNLHFVMVFILRGDKHRGGVKGKMEKSPHSKKIKLGVDFFPFFPLPPIKLVTSNK